MKIGIITFHFVYNCGAVLQCLALSEKLTQLGHEVCVINYQPWYHKNRYAPLKNPIYYAKKCAKQEGANDTFLKRMYRGGRGFASTVYSWRYYPKRKKQDAYFTSFVKKHLNETVLYRTARQLQEKPPKCDVYISGSDQLWNAKITDGMIDPAYLLEFGNEDVKKITFSMGVSFNAMREPVETIKASLMKLDAISLRENDAYNLINELTENKVEMHIDVDPTFLLCKEDYEKYIPTEQLCDEPYILTYTMPDESQQKVNRVAEELGRKTGLRVIDVNGNPQNGNREIKDNRIGGPAEFLWYIKNAEYVVTNSFHGTAFSVNFEKDFVTIPHSHTGYRVTEILDKIGLSNCYATNEEDALQALEMKVDYMEARKKLDDLRNASIEYLIKQIN